MLPANGHANTQVLAWAVASWASLDMAEISRENREKEPATASPSNEWPAV